MTDIERTIEMFNDFCIEFDQKETGSRITLTVNTANGWCEFKFYPNGKFDLIGTYMKNRS